MQDTEETLFDDSQSMSSVEIKSSRANTAPMTMEIEIEDEPPDD